MKHKKIALSAIAITIASIGLFSGTTAFAQTPEDTSSIVQKIADKFNLNKNDVQAIFDQNRTERESHMQAKFEAQLDQYIKDGKLTTAQKQLILDKHKELKANRSAKFTDIKNKTPEERKVLMETEKKALEDWAKKNGIEMQYLLGGRGMRHPHGGHDMRVAK